MLRNSADKMEVRIKLYLENETLTLDCDPKDSIADLKEKIFEEDGCEPDRQRLFYKFILVSNDSILEEFPEPEFYLNLPTAGARKIKIESSQETFILIGNTSNFKCLPLLPNIPEVIKAGKFAIVRNQEDKLYYARKYKIDQDCKINCKSDGKVYMILENGTETELDGELKVYELGQSSGKLKKVTEVLHLSANAASLISSITEFALSIASAVA